MTREEEIIEASQKCNYTLPATLRSGFRDGAKWADANQPNPWRDARLCPPENEENIYLSCNGVKRVGYYNLDSKTYRSYGIYGVCNVDADFWMPIPKTPKGGEA